MYQYFIFFLVSNDFYYLGIPHVSSVDGHSHCFYFLAIMNNAAMNIHAQVFMCTCILISICYIPGVELLGHMIILCVIFWGPPKLFSKIAAQFYIPTSGIWVFQFLHILINTCYYFSLVSGYEVVYLCGFDFHFPDGYWCWTFSLCVYWSFVYLLWRNVFSDSLLILNWVAKNSLYILDINPIWNIWFTNIVSHVVCCLFTSLIVSFDIQKY